MCAALLSLAACSDGDDQGKVMSGEVIAKGHSDAFDTIERTPDYDKSCDPKNKNKCRMVLDGYDERTIHHPECWRFTLKDGKGRVGYVCVERVVWENTKVSEHYNG